jgi:hypothetical protein
MIVDASDVMSHLGTTAWKGWWALTNNAGFSNIGMSAPTTTGTPANAGGIVATNFLTEQNRVSITSLTTANAQAANSSGAAQALVSTTAGHGGFEFTCRFGASTIPTGPRLFVGMTNPTYAGNTGEPSALTANVAAFAKDSTDTNIQLLTNSNAGSGTKIDTGIPPVANGWYEASVWCEPGSNTVYGLLIRLDTGDIWFGSTTTDVPATGAALIPMVIGGLSSTTGTAFVLQFGSLTIRQGL